MRAGDRIPDALPERPVVGLNPAVWSAKARARGKGHRKGERSGDTSRMPGVYPARGGEIPRAHQDQIGADHPDCEMISEPAAAAARGEEQRR